MTKKVTEHQWIELRDKLLSAECITKHVPISAIGIDETSLSRSRIQVNGIEVKVSSTFFTRLAAMLKINQSLTHQMMKNSDGKLAVGLINALKDYRQSRIGGEVLLIADPTSEQIVDICEPSRYRRMSNDSIFDITERILNDNPNLSIETVDRSGGGHIAINLLNNQEVGFPGAGKDEFFKFGFSIIQTPKNTLVEMYNQRLVCSNGLRLALGEGTIGSNRDIRFDERFRLEGTGAEQIREFLGRIEAMRKAEFVPSSFQQTLDLAVNTKASLLEVESAMHTAQRLVNEVDSDLRKNFVDTMGRKYFRGWADTVARANSKGWDSSSLNEKQKSHIKTNQSVWDVVNSLTYLGSNNSGIPMKSQHELKANAGKLFAKGTGEGYDLQFAELASL